MRGEAEGSNPGAKVNDRAKVDDRVVWCGSRRRQRSGNGADHNPAR